MIIAHRTGQGITNPSLLYEPPFKHIAPTGPEQIFDEQKIIRLVARLQALNQSAVAWPASGRAR